MCDNHAGDYGGAIHSRDGALPTISNSSFCRNAPDHITAGENYIEKLKSKTAVVRIRIDRMVGKARK